MSIQTDFIIKTRTKIDEGGEPQVEYHASVTLQDKANMADSFELDNWEWCDVNDWAYSRAAAISGVVTQLDERINALEERVRACRIARHTALRELHLTVTVAPGTTMEES